MSSSEQDKGRLRKAFGRGGEWLGLAREELVEKAQEFGEAEAMFASLEEESDHIESILREESPENYGLYIQQVEATSDYLCSMDPHKPSDYWDKPVAEAAMLTGTTSGSMLVSTSYPVVRPAQFESLQKTVFEFGAVRNDRETVANLLSKLSPRVKNQFDQVWEIWYSATGDHRKPAMYEMRDTVHDTVVHLSRPGRKFPARSTHESRKKRMEWIADNLMSDPHTRKLVRTRAHRYPDLVGRKGLSKAHEPHLDEREALMLLFEAQGFLLELLRSLDWKLVKAKGLCC